MAYGKIKADTFVYDNSGSDAEVTVASLGNKASLPASAGTVGASEVVQVDANKDITGFRNITLSGDLTVNGTTTTINSTTLTVDDKNIELGKVDTPTDTTADGGGITLKGATDKTITWTNATDTWDFNQNISIINPASSGDAFLNIIGGEGGASVIEFKADEGDDNADYWRVQNAGDGILGFRTKASGSWVEEFRVETTGITVNGTVSDSLGNVRKLTNSTQTSAYTLVAADAGKYVLMQGSGGNITIPDSVFSAGDMVTLINHTTSDITIVKGTNMFYTADGSNANRTLAGKGMATLLFTDSATCYISGGGLS